MKSFIKYFLVVGSILSVLTVAWSVGKPAGYTSYLPEALPVVPDSDSLRYPFQDHLTDPYSGPYHQNPLFMQDPSNIKTNVEYDPDQNQYNINQNIGNLFYRNPSYMSFEEFVDQEFKRSTRSYWMQRSGEDDKMSKKIFAPKIKINSVAFDRIFGGNTIDIRPQGSAELIFAVNVSHNENPSLPENQRTVTTFDFKERIQMNVSANIGEKMKLAMNYNTEATFDFENRMKLEYTGYEDDIIKKIEAGNVTLPLNSQLIQGSQSLFGLKTQLQFGRLTVTALFSQQRGRSSTIEVQGGAQMQTFDIKVDQYEANKHFFLSQFFKDNYDFALRDLNLIASGADITKLEVWVTNVGSATQTNRNIIAFADLGENVPDQTQQLVSGIPGRVAPSSTTATTSNDLYDQILLVAGPNSLGVDGIRTIANVGTVLGPLAATYNFNPQKNYETVTQARLLTSAEYTFHSQLGYISLNVALNPNQVLAVAYEYTLGGITYRVGDLSTIGVNSGNEALFAKMLKGTNINPRFYTWDLMMKNIYSLGGYNLQAKDFRLDVAYQDDKIGMNINYIPEGCSTIKGIPLIKLLNLDQLNTNLDAQPDGVFDIVDGLTISMRNGRIIFPVREPFGSYLRSKFCASDGTLPDKYVYDALYDSTKTIAQQQPEKNKFSLKGKYLSASGSDIPLNAVNIPQGAVKVTAGGATLVENQDFTVDYNLGRVRITNEGILRSNTPIKIQVESNSLFNLLTKTMLGGRFDYYVNKDFTVGGTILHLSEKPLTQKVNIGDEPISNTVWGIDGTYRTNSRVLTKVLDYLPLYHTKEISTVTLSGEVAQLIPGHSDAIGAAGTSYVDDFEGAVTPLDIKNPLSWYLASIPQNQPDLFPEGDLNDSLPLGFNRAKTSWYYVDPLFQQTTVNLTPPNITKADQSNNYVREIPQSEIFPNRSQPNGPASITCMNLALYPDERGPYNYDVAPTVLSAGMDGLTGKLKNPSSRWGGIMRRIETNDFEASNIEFIQFWMMDPFADDSENDGTGGDLYFNLGTISEDILRDGQKNFENGLPASTNNYTAGNSSWGRYPLVTAIVNAFDNDETSRPSQDVGLDGLSDEGEQSFFSGYLNEVSNLPGMTQGVYNTISNDPSGDDYSYYQSNTYNANNAKPLERYKKYNGMDGNAPAPPEVDGYNATATNQPDVEDINRDNNMQTYEQYFQYKIRLRPNMQIGQNFITDIVTATVQYADGVSGRPPIKWYQFKIPVQQPSKVINDLDNFKNIQFIRMFLKGFNSPIVCRFAKLELLRGEWRKYNLSLLTPGEYSPTPEVPGDTRFDIFSVSLEENGARSPVPYVLPPGIDKERDISTTQLSTLNEQSLALRVCNLHDGDARAGYKNTQVDIRSYKKLKMFIHAESLNGSDALNYGDLTCFIRLGSDFSDNYYEYEVPLIITSPGTTNPNDIWPEGNNVEIVLDDLVNAKTQRNNAMAQNGSINLLTPYSVPSGSRKITIRGTPNLSNVRSIMIGIRNPKASLGTGPRLCGEIWVNEMRLSDFDEQGGWASTARVTTKLADLGTMTLVGNHSTAGWGSIEKRVSERDRENKLSYDFSTSLELGKFLPPKSNIRVPMFFGYSESFVNPQYNPLDPDVLFENSLDAAPTSEISDSVQFNAQDYTQRKSLNFTNVKKNKAATSKKSHFYDIENVNVSYAYTEQYKRNPIIQYNFAKTHQAAVGYNFSYAPKPITPFAKSKVLDPSFLKLIKDFNFYVAPTQMSLLASLERTYAETHIRNNTGLDINQEPTFAKTYRFNRAFGLKFDLTKSIKVEYDANAEAIIDEPAGKIDEESERDVIINNLKKFGRLRLFRQNLKATYNIPLSKIVLVDWITASASYAGGYTWTAGPQRYDSNTNEPILNSGVANDIQNSQNNTLNGNFNMVGLYNKSAYLRKINQDANKPKNEIGKAPKLPKGVPQDTTQEESPSFLEPVFKGLATLIMSLKSASFTYSATNGIGLPGFYGKPDFLGNDFNYSYPNSAPGAPVSTAPGWGFVFGSQKDPRPDAVKYQWLTNDTTLNSNFTTSKLKNFSARASLEPFRSFKIELTANRNKSLIHDEYYRANAEGVFQTYSPKESGNFTISYISINTAFVEDNVDYSNANFENFNKNRKEVSAILADQNTNSTGALDTAGYHIGYGGTQQEVLTYAFLAAYTGKSPSASQVDGFPKIPKPNWRVTYDGIPKMRWGAKYFQSFNITHSYRSVYSINSFLQNLLYVETNGSAAARDTLKNFIAQYEIQQITIAEQFAPLLGVDMTWKNGFQTRFEYKRDRMLTLAYSSIQVTEVRGVEYTLGLGYRVRRFTLPFIRTGGGKKKLTNDLNLRADFTLRDSKTIIRKLVEGTNQPSAGAQTISYKFSADYAINDRFNVKAFFDKSVNNPFVSSAYPTSFVNSGISLRFTLAQ